MSIVVVGSVAFDSLETPFGKRENALGGSANYFSLSAAFFSDVRLCAVIGEDFPQEHIDRLQMRGIDTAGLQRAAGKTFHWKGQYGSDLNEAKTLQTDLNVFANFDPTLPATYRNASTVFLANIEPQLQRKVLAQVDNPKLVAMDSMNFWISSKRDELVKTIQQVDLLFLNDTEARMLSGEHNIVRAARAIQSISGRRGPLHLVIKRGEYGALLFRGDDISFVPALPLADVFDPTGAGDTFAGGFMGWLDRQMQSAAELTPEHFREAMVMGTVMASYVVEQFSFDRMLTLNKADIHARWRRLHELSAFRGNIELT